METLKVFDCQDMPDKIREQFFYREARDSDCYVAWWVEPKITQETGNQNEDYTPVDGWLLEQGATVDEKVLIHHWW